MNSFDQLKASHPPEPKHRALASSQRQVGVLCAIVRPAASLLASGSTYRLGCCAVGPQLVGHECRFAMPTHRPPEEDQRGPPVAAPGHVAFQDLALVIHGPPKIMQLAVWFHEHLVKVPPPSARSHTANPAFPDLGREHGAETAPLVADSFVAHSDAALVQRVLDVSPRQRETDVEHDCETDNLGRRPEVTERAAFGHPATLVCRAAPGSRAVGLTAPF